MARLRDGGTGSPEHRARAREMIEALRVKINGLLHGDTLHASTMQALSGDLHETLVLAFEAEEALEQHEHCDQCPGCGDKIECQRCDGERVWCAGCGEELVA